MSDRDFEKVSKNNWYAVEKHRPNGKIYAVYAARNHRDTEGKRRLLLMHRFILGVKNPAVDVDHRDGNTLNNTPGA